MHDDRMPARITGDVLAADLQDEAILLEMKSKRYFRLNATGQRIWQLLSQGLDLGALESTLVAEFDVEPAVAAGELDRFLAELGGHGLLRPGDAAR